MQSKYFLMPIKRCLEPSKLSATKKKITIQLYIHPFTILKVSWQIITSSNVSLITFLLIVSAIRRQTLKTQYFLLQCNFKGNKQWNNWPTPLPSPFVSFVFYMYISLIISIVLFFSFFKYFILFLIHKLPLKGGITWENKRTDLIIHILCVCVRNEDRSIDFAVLSIQIKLFMCFLFFSLNILAWETIAQETHMNEKKLTR